MKTTNDLYLLHKDRSTQYKDFSHKILIFIAIFYSLFFIKGNFDLYIIKTIIFYILTTIQFIVFINSEKNNIYYHIENARKIKMLNISLLVLIVLSIVSTINNEHMVESIFGVLPNLISVIFYIFIFLFLNLMVIVINKFDLDKILNLFIKVFIIIGTLISLQYYYSDFFYEENKFLRLFFALGNRNYAVIPFALLMILCIFKYLNEFKKRNIYLIPISIFFNVILISLTRGAWISLIFTFIIIYLYIFKKKKDFLVSNRNHIAIIIILLIIVFILANLLSDFSIYKRITNELVMSEEVRKSDYILNNISSDRIETWINGIKLINNNKRLLIGISPSSSKFYGIRYTNFHNQYIESFVTLGIFGFISFLIFVLCINYYSWYITNKNFNNIGLFACSIFISFKWLFNSINSLNFLYSLIIISIISSKYMKYKK